MSVLENDILVGLPQNVRIILHIAQLKLEEFTRELIFCRNFLVPITIVLGY